MEQGTERLPENIRILPTRIISSVHNFFNPLGTFLSKLNINPNLITILALVFGAVSGALFALGHPFWAGTAILLCGLLDILDGKVAVIGKRQSLFGAIFDSTLDRYSEFFIYFGLAIHFQLHWALWLTFFAFLGSTMVSYTRARAEGLDIECKIGFMQRAERMLLLSLASFFGIAFHIFDPLMIISLGLISLISNFTALQRLYHVKKVELSHKSQQSR